MQRHQALKVWVITFWEGDWRTYNKLLIHKGGIKVVISLTTYVDPEYIKLLWFQTKVISDIVKKIY